MIKRLIKYVLCGIGVHSNFDWHPYPKSYPECTVKKCINCDYYEWR